MNLDILKQIDLNNPLVKNLIQQHVKGDKADLVINMLSKFLKSGGQDQTQKKELDTLISGNSKFNGVEDLLNGLKDGVDMKDVKNLMNVAKGFFK